mmetsp:Transcript_7100/g.8191  ORF Transcript_7100/g.8191 Transcript_7100/m.8191 type:complete len:358 (+) Transcript_7100:236-1309(+)|eukprot:CAMPEP_0197861410 /NCGR_PEP_ID=MMETSP1438-20131217/37465_1 /TAXON_ID=1461541 /ORGANISM="Pterosperma sp., Strain CCMP1384" /LENGTH=357 /DNA_ID=CAMNT_0043478579 /DNA_START=234 /DNA_END=1307 /DNA_ORIENTATION=-
MRALLAASIIFPQSTRARSIFTKTLSRTKIYRSTEAVAVGRCSAANTGRKLVAYLNPTTAAKSVETKGAMRKVSGPHRCLWTSPKQAQPLGPEQQVTLNIVHRGGVRSVSTTAGALNDGSVSNDGSTGGPLPDTPQTADQEGNPPPSRTPWIKFCCFCGGAVKQAIPEGDNMWRPVCVQCKRPSYQNPKVVAGCVVLHESKVLLCRRAIEPCKGLWTLPAGYVELGESVLEGAVRETLEEANAVVTNVLPYFQLDIPRIGQVYMIYRGDLQPPHTFSPGVETLETALFAPEDIPFDSIAFSAIRVVLQQLCTDLATNGASFAMHNGVIAKKDGSAPSDPHGYEFINHVSVPPQRSAL